MKVTLAGYKRHLRAGAAPGPLSRKDHEDDDDADVADTYVDDDVVAFLLFIPHVSHFLRI